MSSLTTLDTGTYKITTKSGAEYQLDLDNKTLTRVVEVPAGMTTPKVGLPDNNFGEYTTGQSRLRGDNDPVPLVNILHCAVGTGAVFLVIGLGDNVVSLRQTSQVVSIEKYS